MPLVYNPRTGEFDEKRHQNPPKIAVFRIHGDNTVLVGDTYTVSWVVEDAENIQFDGRNVSSGQTSRTLSAITEGTITHKIVVSNDCGTIEQSITVRSLAKPLILLKATKRKLREGVHDSTTLKWDVQNARTVSFVIAGSPSLVGLNGSKVVSPSTTTTYKIVATALNGNTTVEKEITVEVFPVAKIMFNSNREFTLPKVPIVLSWDVQNALSVELVGFGTQALNGELVVQPEVETTYVLKVKDHFETKTQKLTIRLLPVPFIKTVMVPTPQLAQNLHLQLKQPQLNVSLELPHINVIGVTISVPEIKTIKASEFYGNLEPPLQRTFGIFGKIKSLFNYYYSKI